MVEMIGHTIQEIRAGKQRPPRGSNIVNTYERYKVQRQRFLKEYYSDIMVNRFNYSNAPITLNTFLIEHLLFQGVLGVAVGEYEGALRVLGVVGNNGSITKQGNYGTLTTGLYTGFDSIEPFIPESDFKSMTQINPATDKMEGDYVVIVNKDSAMYNPTAVSDKRNIALYADELAEIDKIAYSTRQMLQTSLMVMGKKGTVDKSVFMEEWGRGASFIQVDDTFKPQDITAFQGKPDGGTQGVLQMARDNKEAELWSYMGINNMVSSKKERMLSAEATSKTAAITLASNVSLNPRKRAMDIINKKWSYNIDVHFAYEEIQNVTGDNSHGSSQEVR